MQRAGGSYMVASNSTAASSSSPLACSGYGEIRSFFYFPSIVMQRAADGYGGLQVHSCLLILSWAA
ncbi:hypothetical protein Cni_G29447 [Canna indica]|uniref:Uncharacterized protein n=1 Tax=Canna indica TaxID=4628 RepID=A0AAQ3LBN8_9LILI|nr:hypothetical protein Cni_G29447 [Canna indica]